jgi:hypothetical protein
MYRYPDMRGTHRNVFRVCGHTLNLEGQYVCTVQCRVLCIKLSLQSLLLSAVRFHNCVAVLLLSLKTVMLFCCLVLRLRICLLSSLTTVLLFYCQVLRPCCCYAVKFNDCVVVLLPSFTTLFMF